MNSLVYCYLVRTILLFVMSEKNCIVKKLLKLKIPVVIIPSDYLDGASTGMPCCQDGTCMPNCMCCMNPGICECSPNCSNCTCNTPLEADANADSSGQTLQNGNNKLKHYGHGYGHGRGHGCWSDDSSSSDEDYWCAKKPDKSNRLNKSNKSNKLKISKERALYPAFEKYIVVFKDNTDDYIKNKIQDLGKKNAFKIKHTILNALKACTVTMDKKIAEDLMGDPDVQYVEKDSLYSDTVYSRDVMTAAAEMPLWNQDITNTIPKSTDNFSNVHCYILDTGIMGNHIEFFPNQVFLAYNAINKSINAQDDNGHGTCVASVIGGKTTGAANKIVMHSIKVLDSSGSGYVSDIIAGLNWVIKNKKRNAIVNMSLGGMYSKSLDATIKSCVLANIPIVCSAGNSGVDASNFSPANSSGICTVSSYDKYKNKPTWANYGSVITTFAPGDVIKAAWSDAVDSYYLVSGTSFSAPIVVGIIARFMSIRPNATLLQIMEFVNKSEILNEILNPGSINTSNKRIVFNPINI